MSKNAQFEKFINKKKGSVLKEKIKQEKKAYKKDRALAIEKRFEEKRLFREKGIRPESTETPAPRGKRPGAPEGKTSVGRNAEARSAGPGSKRTTEKSAGAAPQGRTSKSTATGNEARSARSAGPRVETRTTKVSGSVSPVSGADNLKTGTRGKADTAPRAAGARTAGPGNKSAPGQSFDAKGKPAMAEKIDQMPLNKYIAHSGICSRRDAAELVKKGGVLVNGTEATDPGMKVSINDIIKINGKKVVPEQSFVYILLNKPKDYITTTDDPQGRKTVLELIRNATDQRVYPIGRLDRNTSGVLLFTNDGDLAQTLSHPKHEIKKIYEVRLDKEFAKADFETLTKGVQLEDGFIAPDVLAYADSSDKSVIGVEIHSGRNRIVRRIFEKLGYDVRGLDRVMYAGLTKKNVQRGKYRHLTEREIRILKHFNKDTKTNKHA